MSGPINQRMAPQNVPNWNQIVAELARLATIARTQSVDVPSTPPLNLDHTPVTFFTPEGRP